MKYITFITTIVISLFFANTITAQNQPDSAAVITKVDQCISCHKEQEDKPSKLFPVDVHYKKGISCADCHGGDRTAEDQDAAMNPEKGFIGVPSVANIPQMCGKCHGDKSVMKRYGSQMQTALVKEYLNSAHGQKLKNGDTKIAQCVTCHSVHNIASKKDLSSPVYPTNVPKLCAKCHADAGYMKTYDPAFPVDQYQKYQTSVHGKLNLKGDAKVATCVSCHTAHDILNGKFPRSSVYPVNIPATCNRCHGNAEYMRPYGIPTDQYKKYSGSVHGKALLEKKDISAPACNSCHGNHGAVPPGVSSISNVCGTCHALNAQLFSQSPHEKAFEAKKLPQCETCHSNHDVQPVQLSLLGVNEGAVCVKCHKPTDRSKGYNIAATMRKMVDSLMNEEKSAEKFLDEAEQKGMEVEQARFVLKDVRQALIQSRTVIHTADLDKFKEVVGKGLTIASSAKKDGEEAIHEYYYRRTGLGIATLLITVLVITVYLKLRNKERREK